MVIVETGFGTETKQATTIMVRSARHRFIALALRNTHKNNINSNISDLPPVERDSARNLLMLYRDQYWPVRTRLDGPEAGETG